MTTETGTTSATAAVGTARVHYTRTGTADTTLVLVHGTGSAGAELTWGQLVPRFTDRRTVLAPDLSGTDRTTDDGAPLSVEGLARQVAAVIEDAATASGPASGPVDLLGFSLGAPVVAAVAATRPDLVRRLVTVAGWAHTDGDAYLRNLFTVWQRLGGLDAETFGRLVTATGFSGGFLNALGRDEVEQLIPNMPPTPGTLRHVGLNLRIDIRALLPLVQAPTLVIGCAQDATVPVRNSHALHRAIAGSRYAELDTGHVAFFEQPDAFVELVRDFLLAS